MAVKQKILIVDDDANIAELKDRVADVWELLKVRQKEEL